MKFHPKSKVNFAAIAGLANGGIQAGKIAFAASATASSPVLTFLGRVKVLPSTGKSGE